MVLIYFSILIPTINNKAQRKPVLSIRGGWKPPPIKEMNP